MADQLGSAVLTLSVDDRQFNAGLQKAQSTVEGVGASFRSALGTLGLATSAAGIAAFVGNQVTQLDAASAAVRTLGVDSDELGKRLRALSLEFDSNISTLDLTKAAYDVASSGFSSAADATQILRASALGAKGGFAEVNDVATALTGVLNAYGLSASEATKIVDGFVQTQADGVITVRQYAAEIGNIASIASASGVGIEELNAAIATVTLRGVPVAQTFTGLRQALSNIIKPSKEAAELAQSLGIEFNVGALQAKGLGGVLADVQQKTGGAADKIAILLGSVEAQAAIQPLLNDKLVKYNELLDKQAQSSGAAASASQTNTNTISGGLQQIGNGFSNLATTLDTVLTPLFAGFIKDVNSILAKLNQVAALAPEKVQAREKQATDAVAGQLFPGQGSGFFGAITINYGGKTYKGSATGIREAIIQDLLKQDLAKINEASATGSGKAAAKSQPNASQPAGSNKQDSSIDQSTTAKMQSAGTMLKDSMVAGADAIMKAAEKARNDFESAAKALQSTYESNFKFLTKDAQNLVLQQARQDIANGVQSGNIDSKYLNARKPEDVIAAASASRSQLEAINNFNKAALDYSSAVNQSNQTLGTVSNQLPEVANNIVALQGSLDGLASKDWSVNVSVTGDSAANVRVD